MELKLRNLVELDNLQKEITEEILDILSNESVEWRYHSINTNSTNCDGDTDYFCTPYRSGFIIISGSELYYSCEESDYTWCNLAHHKSILLGNYDIVADTYWKLDDMYSRMKILSA